MSLSRGVAGWSDFFGLLYFLVILTYIFRLYVHTNAVDGNETKTNNTQQSKSSHHQVDLIFQGVVFFLSGNEL